MTINNGHAPDPAAVDPATPEPEAETLTQRVAAWTRDLGPRNSVEAYLVGQSAGISLDLDRLTKVIAARDAHQARTAPALEAERAEAATIALGRELLDPAADEWVRQNPQWTGKPHDPNGYRPPEVVAFLLRGTPGGCRWMAGHWDDLATILDDNLNWGTADTRRAVRLLGKEPDSGEDNPEVRALQLAIHVSNSQVPQHLGELTEAKLGRPVPTLDAAKEMLRDLCRSHAARLRSKAIELESAVTPEVAAIEAARFGFDLTEGGKELRRSQSTLRRELLKSIETLMKMQKNPLPGPEIDGSPSPDNAPKTDAKDTPAAPSTPPDAASKPTPETPAATRSKPTSARRRRPSARRLLERAKAAPVLQRIAKSSPVKNPLVRGESLAGSARPPSLGKLRVNIKACPPLTKGDAGGFFDAKPLPHPPP